ncbi:MAG: OmpA family protein [Proteobacteria bacterium]|nr:OmpA family protein [Pseudomonadota bacterium]
MGIRDSIRRAQVFGVALLLVSASAARAQPDEFDDSFGDDAFGDSPQQDPFGDAGEGEESFDSEFEDAFEGYETPPEAGASEIGQGPDEAAQGGGDRVETTGPGGARMFRAHTTWGGPTGGLRITDAGSGIVDALRTQLTFEFFRSRDFLDAADTNQFIAGTLALNYTPASFLELYASIANHANSNSNEEPALFQVLGDSTFGVKAFSPVLSWLTLGGDLRLVLLNTVGDIGVVLKGTSFGLRGNATADMRRVGGGVPLLVRLNLDYFFDNSANLVQSVEERRFGIYRDLGQTSHPEQRFNDIHLLTRIERFALGINRTDMLTLSLGFEAPLRAGSAFYLHPLLEWSMGMPVNRQGWSCLIVNGPNRGRAGGPDSCLKGSGLGAFPMTLTLGLRVLPPVRGLGFLLAFEGGLTGASKFVRELSPNRPYNLMLALAYAYDTRLPKPIVRRVEVAKPVEAPSVKGRIQGSVIEKGAEIGVSGATVQYQDGDFSLQQTFENGAFVSYELDPGEVIVRVSHPDYEPADCAAVIPGEGGEVQMRCELVAKPRVGDVQGRVVDAKGGPVLTAKIDISGPAQRTITSDVTGAFKLAELPPGEYTARVDAEGFMIELEQFTVVARKTATPVIALVPKPKRALVKLTRKRINIRRKIHFVTDSHEIRDKSTPLLRQIADIILRHPELKRIEIQGHTDSVGSDSYNVGLSQNRAGSVRSWLVNAGVKPDRLEAKGYGATRPLAPNITAGNRARNRRVQFMIRERVEPKPE